MNKYTWNLEKLYKSENDPNIEKDIQKSETMVQSFIEKWSLNQEYLSSPQVLAEALKEYESLNEGIGVCDKPLYYLILRNAQDQTDTEIKGKLNKISDIATKLENDLRFFDLNISKIPREKQEKFLSSDSLKEYKHLLEVIFKLAQYRLSEKEENIFTLMSKPSFSNWVDMLSELLDKQEVDIKDENEKHITVNYNNISKYLDSTKKEVRDCAAKEFNKINEKYLEIAEFEINSVLESKKIYDEYRHIERPDLMRHLADDIDSSVVDTLVQTVTENFDISQKYYKLKSKLLEQDTLGYHERNVPVGEVISEYPFEESMSIVKKTMGDLDEEFLQTVKRFEEEGAYDVESGKGKSGGAFCINVNKSLPTYILLNHNNRLNDVLTIAHESGHGIHSEFSRKQNSLNSDYPTSLAEVASTFFEDFTLNQILKSKNEKQDIIIHQKLNSDISSIFRQIAFYNFEKELHQEYRKLGYLKKEYISDIFCKHMIAYLGESVDADEGMRNGWIYVSHFRRFFYVYSYASGLLISKSLQVMVKEDKKNIEYFKKLLSAGSSKSPKDIFYDMGIDISKKGFWQKGINEVKYSVDNIN